MTFSSPQQALAFYGEVINRHDFDALLPVLADEVTFWFSSGSFVGLVAARAAFEATWARIVDEHYWLENVEWLANKGDGCAVCLYRFNWRGQVDGVFSEGGGRGTSVLIPRDGSWLIAHAFEP